MVDMLLNGVLPITGIWLVLTLLTIAAEYLEGD